MSAAACPDCGGLSQPQHPGGELAGWHHDPTCPLLAAEDGRAVGDSDLLDCHRGAPFAREATTTEQGLLAALGLTGIDTSRTIVSSLTPGVRRRVWKVTA
jgi:hypothetical protein